MRRAMIAAGLDPDAPDTCPNDQAPGSESGLMEVDAGVATNSKKRLPSGSPEGKGGHTVSDDSYDDTIDAMEAEKGKDDWRIYQLRKNKNSPEKKMTKKAKRLAKAKAGKMV